MKIIGLTMAKEMSERLPRKNLLPFAGRPLLEWMLIAMRASRYMSEWWIVTESEEIAALARKYDFRIVWQTRESAATAGHYGGPVCEGLFFEAITGQYADTDVLVSGLPTSPCRKPEDFDVAIAKFMSLSVKHPGKTIAVTSGVRQKCMSLAEQQANGTLKDALFDNLGKYIAANGAVGIRSMGYAAEQARQLPPILAAFKAGKHYAGFAKPPDISVSVEHEIWQQWDIDSMADFQLCEQAFITNGLGERAYRLYKGEY